MKLHLKGKGNKLKKSVQVCPVCPDFSTESPKPLSPEETGTIGHPPCHCLCFQLLLLQASETALSDPWVLGPNSPSSGRLRKDRAIQTQPRLASASGSPRVPGDRNDIPGSEAQASPRLPRGWQMWRLISQR